MPHVNTWLHLGKQLFAKVWAGCEEAIGGSHSAVLVTMGHTYLPSLNVKGKSSSSCGKDLLTRPVSQPPSNLQQGAGEPIPNNLQPLLSYWSSHWRSPQKLEGDGAWGWGGEDCLGQPPGAQARQRMNQE
jgi:hypothetical protein